ncbi:CheR family methyltransferase [Undibacterium sp.]|uniref:CheR family methyltransferase n=1 Tax=Undibacterium sp. TaxID=1914977 RepID=UPI00374CCA33
MAAMPTLEEIEVDLLLEGIYRYWGDDFRHYDRRMLTQKISGLMQDLAIRNLSALQERVLHDPKTRELLLQRLVLRPGRLFDNPRKYHFVRDTLVPRLRTHAEVNIWVAECGSMAEVCTLAILLEEEGLSGKTQIYATSASELALQEIRHSGFTSEELEEFDTSYRDSGGKHALAEYMSRGSSDEDDGKDRFYLREDLSKNIIWSPFSLGTDASFNEFELIMCPHGLYKFGPALRRRAVGVFIDSLSTFGVLDVPSSAISTPELETRFAALSPEFALFRQNSRLQH